MKTSLLIVPLILFSGCFAEPPMTESEDASSTGDHVVSSGTSGASLTASGGTTGHDGSSEGATEHDDESSGSMGPDDESGDEGTGESSGGGTGTTGGTTGGDSDPLEGMVIIPGQAFIMGCDTELTENVCGADEFPAHTVELEPFAIDPFEVTVSEYTSCLDGGECPARSLDAGCNGLDKPDHPANCVSWEQARQFCEWSSKRLPSEAEWEFTAEGPGGNLWPWGAEPYASCPTAAVFGQAAPGCGSGGTLPVGSMDDQTPTGVHDMSGNVQEWTNDWYSPDAYQSPDPPASGELRAARGASYELGGTDTRIRKRSGITPESSSPNVGFRCALSIE